MLTRSSVLGKRDHQESSTKAEQLQTPDRTPNPKRARTTLPIDDDSNKENIPPFTASLINVDVTPRSARALRRNATEMITPTRSRPALRRNASVASLPPITPATETSKLVISTPPPTPPNSLLPLHARARALLRSTCNSANTEIAGRSIERASILSFLATFMEAESMNDDDNAHSMFISGSPGTGKTALVNVIIRELSTLTGSDVKVVFINCMALKSVDALWERMIEDLSDGSKRKFAGSRKPKGRDAVKALLKGLNSKCILILDELDHITSSAQSLTSIFTLTEAMPAVLRLIGIANTHTLTSSTSMNSFLPSSNVQTIHFAPYTPVQLQEILKSRLATLSNDEKLATQVKNFLPNPTLTLLTKKVAALTGDVRSLFEVLRSAIDLAVTQVKKPSEDENPLNTPLTTVMPQHVLAALKAYTPVTAVAIASTATPSTSQSNSETVTKIRNLGLQARLVLLTILLASKRLEAGLTLSPTVTSSPRKPSASPMKRTSSLPIVTNAGPGIGIDTTSLYTFYSAVLSRTEIGIFEPVSRSEFGDLMGVLEGVGIVSLSSSLLAIASGSSSGSGKGRKAFGRSTSFGAGLGKNGAGALGEVRLVEGMWGDEVLRGLGVNATPATNGMSDDPREEELCGIWKRERVRLTKNIKTAAATSKASQIDTIAGAFQD